MFGAIGQAYSAPQRFAFTTSWRYSKSDRHYVGSHYQRHRDEEGSQVINRVSTFDFNFKWNINDRWNLSASLPYQRATRSSPLRGPAPDRVVLGRSDYRADGFGDMVVTARRWMLRPSTHPGHNVSLGVGIKLPTGDDSLKSYRYRLDGTDIVRTDQKQYVDRSVMPGDGGGVGYLVDFAWFQSIAKGHMTFYTSGGYLFNPKNRNQATNNSVPDQYIARVGAIFTGRKWKGIAIGLGGRLEGSPAWDVFGDEDGGRRPGYSIAIEPSLSWTKGPNSIAVAVPFRQYANRTRNNGDIEDGGHGDAAFADYVVLLSYTRRFGDRVKVTGKPADEAKPSASSCPPKWQIKDAPAADATTIALSDVRYREAMNAFTPASSVR